MNERAEAEPAAIVRSGSGGLWLDGAPDQSEGSLCLHSSRGVSPLREPWPRSKPVAEGRTKPTPALSPALCTPMGLFIRQALRGTRTSLQQQSWLFTDSWLTVATSTLISAARSCATVWLTNVWMSADNCGCNARVCVCVGKSFEKCVFADCKNVHSKWILYVNSATLLFLSSKSSTKITWNLDVSFEPTNPVMQVNYLCRPSIAFGAHILICSVHWEYINTFVGPIKEIKIKVKPLCKNKHNQKSIR